MVLIVGIGKENGNEYNGLYRDYSKEIFFHPQLTKRQQRPGKQTGKGHCHNARSYEQLEGGKFSLCRGLGFGV